MNISSYVSYFDVSNPRRGLVSLPYQKNDDYKDFNTINSKIGELRRQIEKEIESIKTAIKTSQKESLKNANLMIEDIPNIQQIPNQHLLFQNTKSYLIENKNYIDSLMRMSNSFYNSDKMNLLKNETKKVLNFFNKLENYQNASRLFNIQTIRLLIPELEIDITKYWNRYFQYSGIPSIQKFIDNNKLILDYDATIDNNNNITILKINFNDTISKIFPLAVHNLFDQNPKDQQIILFNLLTNVSNLDAVKYEIEEFYNTRIIDIFNQENYVVADFFSLLDDFNKILPDQTSILQNLLKQIQDDFKKRIFNQNLNRNLISGLNFYERCRFIPYKEFPIEKLLIAMDYYVVTNQNFINDETGEKNSFTLT